MWAALHDGLGMVGTSPGWGDRTRWGGERAWRGKGVGDLVGQGMGTARALQTSRRGGWQGEAWGCRGGDRDGPGVMGAGWGGHALHLQ